MTFPDEPEIRNFYVYSGRLASMVSLAILQIPKTLKVLSDDISTSTPSAPTTDRSFYIKDPSAIVAITNCMQESAGNYTSSSFAVIGWTWILKYIQALVRENTVWDEGDEFAAVSAAVEQYQNLLPQLFPSTVDVGLRNLGTRAVGPMQHDTIIAFEPSGDGSSGSDFRLGCEEDGLRMKNVLADLVRRTQGYFDFSGNLITSCFLTTDIEYSDVADFKRFMEQDTTNEEDSSESWTGSPARRFLGDDGTQQLLLRAKNRFPHEPLPFMRLVRGLATEDTQIVDFLLNMDTYTQSLPSGFKDYDDYGDEESGNIQLASDLDLFPAREGGMFELDDSDSGSFSSHGGIRIPSGTQGVQISSGGVVAWKHSYNALALFGRILETGADTQPGGELETLVNPETVTEIVSILTVLVACSSEAAAASARKPGQYEIPRVIGEASEMLRRNRDVISVIFDILDTAMNRYTIDNPFFVVGLEFVDSLVNLAPGRVWPYLARSVLLERQGRGGAFSGYLTAVEVVQGSYDFTLACLTLFEHLVDEAIRSAAVHKGRSKSLVHPSSKTAPQGPGGMGVSDVVQRDILLGFTRVVVDIFESYRGFKYVKDIAQKLDIGTKIARIFTTILYNVYGVDESSDIENKITSVLGPSAEYLVSVFLSAGTSDLPIEPIMAAIMDGVQTPETSLYLKNLGKWVEQVVQVVRFADVLVRVRLYLGLVPPPSMATNIS